MARRTKEQAQETRNKLLDAAELLFQAHGVAGTSLQAIARTAGTSRGAVYWHFEDKAALFNAMLERVTLPMEQAFGSGMPDTPDTGFGSVDHAGQIRAVTLKILSQIAVNPQTRRVLEVATQKVEYVKENQAIRARHLAVRQKFMAHCASRLALAAAQAGVALSGGTDMAARGFHALIDGLIQNWLLDPLAFDLVAGGLQAMEVYLRGLGLPGQSGRRAVKATTDSQLGAGPG
ncbi:MAG: TetR family transcriptional regulator [Polaromonas sp.]|nr:TetR family transcriptional regulator [Polaromonas sp.]